MGESDKTNLDIEDPKSKVVVGGRGHSKHYKQMLWLMGILSLTLVVIGVFLWAHYNRPTGQNEASSLEGKAQALTPLQQSQVLANSGQYDPAQQVLANQAKSAANKADQASFYDQQATLALNNNKLDDAKMYAQQAEVAAPSYKTAQVLGDIALQAKNNADAKHYYQLTVDRFKAETPNKDEAYQYTLLHYENQLQEVSQ